MNQRFVRTKGESSSRREPRRLLLEAQAGDRVRVRIHNPDDTSGYEFSVPRTALERLVGPGPVAAADVAVDGTTATAYLAVRTDLHAHLWVRTPGDDGWDILVMQMTFAKKLAELARA